MTRPQNKNLKPFKKGQSGNPNGRPKVRDGLQDVKLLSKTDARRLVQKIIDMTPEELMDFAIRKDVPALETMLAAVAVKAISEGDHSRINFLLDRTVGKVIDKHEHEVVNVTYRTSVAVDGSLIQEIEEEENTDG